MLVVGRWFVVVGKLLIYYHQTNDLQLTTYNPQPI